MTSSAEQVKSTLAKITVEPVLFFYMLGIFLLFSVYQNLVYQMVCINYFNETLCNDLYNPENGDQLDLVQTQSSFWVKMSTVSMVLPSILVDCYLGSWGDVFGRKIPLILPPIGAFMGNLVYICQVLHPEIGVKWILLASFMQGIFGSFTSLFTGALSYVATTTNAAERTSRISVVMSMSFVAGTTGPFLSGYLAKTVSHLFVFIIIGCCHILATFFAAFRIRNIKMTHSDESLNQLTLKRIFSLDHIKESWQICFGSHKTARELCYMTSLFISALIVMIVTTGELDIAFFFMKDKPLTVQFETFCYWLGAKYGVNSLILLIGLPFLKYLGFTDKAICVMGLVSKIAGLFVLAFSTNIAMIFIDVIVGGMAQCALTSMRAMMSQATPTEDQGKIFGFFAVFEDVSTLFGAVIFNTLYPMTRPFFNGTMFVGAGLVLVIPLIIVLTFIVYPVQSTRTTSIRNL